MQEKETLEITEYLPHLKNKSEVAFGSNAVRLSGRRWICVGMILLGLLNLIPRLWKRIEKFEPQPDYRIPYNVSDDYWMYTRYSEWASLKYPVLIFGDSVIWGQYVSKGHTLSHCLNKLAGEERFANMGIDGMHPVALAGLLQYYSQHICRKTIVLHCNPLWMSSLKHDLRIQEEFRFNHPKLVPQFFPNIPCYKEPYSERIGIVLGRHMSFHSWVVHLEMTHFNNMNLSTWTMEHPYDNPLEALGVKPSPPENGPRYEPVPWSKRGIEEQEFSWVELETSLQWRFFLRSLEILQGRGNKVFVLVGPFNEHMLKKENSKTYNQLKDEIEVRLKSRNVACYIPSALPSETYADASHPLDEGYLLLAKRLSENSLFREIGLPIPQPK